MRHTKFTWWTIHLVRNPIDLTPTKNLGLAHLTQTSNQPISSDAKISQLCPSNNLQCPSNSIVKWTGISQHHNIIYGYIGVGCFDLTGKQFYISLFELYSHALATIVYPSNCTPTWIRQISALQDHRDLEVGSFDIMDRRLKISSW